MFGVIIKPKTPIAFVALMVLAALLGVRAQQAKADTPPPASTSTTTVVEGSNDVAQISSSSSSKATLTVLSYEKANGMSKTEVSKAKAAGQCRWIGDGTDVPTYWNSGFNASGVRFWFVDHRHVYECNMHKVKCGNELRFTMPKTTHIVHGIVVMVRSFGKFAATARAQASAHASDWCGSASASASAVATLSGRTRMEARGNARLLANVRATVNASAKASAQVHCGQQSTKTTTTTTAAPPTTTTPTPTPTCQDKSATNYGGNLPCQYPPSKQKCSDQTATNYGGDLPCVYPPKPTCQDHTATNYGGPLPCQYPPPVKHTVQITCTGFEELFGGESMLIKCDVSNDNGAPIALAAKANDANSRVSGINCHSQDGSSSCNGNGTFEFRVSGNNDTSGTLMSSVTATATSNGVSAVFNSGLFPVDPIDGGF